MKSRCSTLTMAVTAAALCTCGWALADDGPAINPSSSEFTKSGIAMQPVQGGVSGLPCGDTSLTQSADPNTIVAGTVQCAVAGAHTVENGLARSFALASDTDVCGVRFGVETNTGGAWDATINLYAGDINGSFGGLDLRGSSTVTIPDGAEGEFFVALFDPPVEFSSGENMVVEIFNPSRDPAVGGDGGALWPGSNNLGESAPSYIRSVDCGIPDFATYGSIGFPNVHLLIEVFAGGGGCLGDLDDSGEVDGADLALLLGAWGPCDDPDDCVGDLDESGEVDGADLALLLGAWGECPGPPPPACGDFQTGDCCEANGSPFCNDAECCEQVCASDPFCCDTEWDSTCAATADAECAVCEEPPAPLNDTCDGAIDITGNIGGDPVTGDNTLASPGPGDPDVPAGSPTCHWSGAPEAIHNTLWYKFTAPEGGIVDITSCGSTGSLIDSVIAVYDGTCGSFVEVACGEDECGAPTYFSTLTADGLTPGEEYYVLFANTGDWAGSAEGTFSFTITAPTPPSNCCEANPGSKGCDDQACEDAVCAELAFCCSFEWDDECATLANEICEVCEGGGGGGPDACGAGAGDCCVSNGTPGCDDEECCATVCAADPFCCDTSWDQLCADQAVDLCGVLCN